MAEVKKRQKNLSNYKSKFFGVLEQKYFRQRFF